MQVEDQDQGAIQAAFEARYQRDWNDPFSDEVKAIWAEAWRAAQAPSKAVLAETLAHITPKPWEDATLLHARVSEFLGRPVEYPELVAAARSKDTAAR